MIQMKLILTCECVLGAKGRLRSQQTHLMGEMNGVRDKVNLNSFHGHEFVFKDGSEDGHGRLLHKVAVDNDQCGR
jgi:hypothetical protein